jgi:hypothetical protein
LISTKLFHAMTGHELAKVILDDIGTLLDSSQTLQEHLTFPTCTYKIRVELESYPMNDKLVIASEKSFETLEVEKSIGETQETAPDAIREQHQLPTLRTERQPDTGGHIDVEQKPKIVVGKGTAVRARAAAVKAKPATTIDPNALVDDDGQVVKTNKGA